MKEDLKQIQTIFGSTLVANQSNLQTQRRYFYLRIKDIVQVNQKIDNEQQNVSIHKKKKHKQAHKIAFQMGLRKSDTRFNLDADRNLDKKDKKRVKKQAHIFCYQADELLTIFLTYEKENTDGLSLDQYHHYILDKPVGFAKVLLTPFIQLPETKHQVTVNLVHKTPEQEIYNYVVAVVKLQIYFLLEFNAKLIVQPVNAALTRNIASIGQMSIGMIFQMNEQRMKSTVAERGGIHPEWDVRADQDEPDKLLNHFQFNLISAGHKLLIKLVDFPILGENATLIGYTKIKIDGCNFLKTPCQIFQHKGKNSLKIFHYDGTSNKEAGEVCLKTTFVYDDKKIRRKIDSEDSDSEIE